ncbi:hypothetical protein IG3_05402 [Bacillus cereus HuA2-1]|uniref:Uncharacterized protein n=2 Tax=Bacillaceae TaxID=186817 RepID=J9BQ63_BACCE|nr:hypothetical protein IG3_05402 [Bacillus cereus HuA2-1]
MKKKNICKRVDYDFFVSVLSQANNYVELHSKLQTYIQQNKNLKSSLRKRAN